MIDYQVNLVIKHLYRNVNGASPINIKKGFDFSISYNSQCE